jgi:hypothetical protein
MIGRPSRHTGRELGQAGQNGRIFSAGAPTKPGIQSQDDRFCSPSCPPSNYLT